MHRWLFYWCSFKFKEVVLKKTLILVVAVLFMGIPAVQADEAWIGGFEFSPYIGYGFPSDDLEDDFLYGLRFGYNFTEYIGAELEYNVFDTKWENTGIDYDINNLRLSTLVNFNSEQMNLVPYLKAGVGKMDEEFAGADVRRDWAYNIGGGLRYFFPNSSFGVRLEALQIFGDETDVLEVSAGFTKVFGRKVGDSDGDGVNDRKDKCPGTPKGATVDPVGCPKDSDGDGVYDGIDQCPDTPKGAKVDSKGCPMDSDGDGVYDGLDKCPGTPKGAKVDKDGCPLDGDKDGVYDGLDKCPDSAPGAKVDANGCEIKKEEVIKVDETIILENLYFDTNKSNIDNQDAAILDKWVNVLKENPKMEAMIMGHTDSDGAESYNQKLSQSRADSVMAYMVSKGIDKTRLTAKGYGESQPIAPNTTKDGKAKNRRVELKRTK